jgi:hypothetical protein
MGERQVGGACHRDRQLVHAADHDPGAVLEGDLAKPRRGGEAAALHQLDAEEPNPAADRLEGLVGSEHRLIRHHRHHRLRRERGHAIEVAGSHRLLDELDLAGQRPHHLSRLIDGVALVRVEPDRDPPAVLAAESANPRDVLLGIAPALDLQDPESLGEMLRGGGGGLLDAHDADRDRGRDLAPRSSEKGLDRDPPLLPP